MQGRSSHHYARTPQPGRFQHHQANHKGASGDCLLDALERSGKVPSREKFRRMICQTFLSTGGCPYADRCVFLHDPRLLISEFKVKPTKNARQATASKDTFYWPDQNREDVSSLLDAQGLPDANQPYNIPGSFASAVAATDNNNKDQSLSSVQGTHIGSSRRRHDTLHSLYHCNPYTAHNHILITPPTHLPTPVTLTHT